MSADNTTLPSCGFPFLPLDRAKLSSDLYAEFIVRITVNALTCPFVIVLNILVMVAVKSKRQLRTTSNIALACLATTDLMVGLVVQPLHISSSILLFDGDIDTFCSLSDTAYVIGRKFVAASLFHLFVISSERYVAIKHPFVYENQVTKCRVIIASGLAWATAILFPIEELLRADISIVIVRAISLSLVSLFLLIGYFNVSVYQEVRRNEKQIAANQVSLEAKERLLKNKKAFYTTIIVVLTMFLCYVPLNISVNIVASSKERIPTHNSYAVLYLLSSLPVVNSLFNPLIYAGRMRYFRVAIIQLFSRNSASQAAELERKTFEPRQIGTIADAEQGENIRTSREEQQGNETLNNGNETAV